MERKNSGESEWKPNKATSKFFGKFSFSLPLDFSNGDKFSSSRNVGETWAWKKLHTFLGVDNGNIRHNFGRERCDRQQQQEEREREGEREREREHAREEERARERMANKQKAAQLAARGDLACGMWHMDKLYDKRRENKQGAEEEKVEQVMGRGDPLMARFSLPVVLIHLPIWPSHALNALSFRSKFAF